VGLLHGATRKQARPVGGCAPGRQGLVRHGQSVSQDGGESRDDQ
jgi:hypothetical protein